MPWAAASLVRIDQLGSGGRETRKVFSVSAAACNARKKGSVKLYREMIVVILSKCMKLRYIALLRGAAHAKK